MGDKRKRRDALKPVGQDAIAFQGRQLTAVVLDDGRICLVLPWLCEGLHLDPDGQLERVQGKTALADGLVNVEVETASGLQEMPAITLDVLPGFLFTLDEQSASDEVRADIVLFQRECVQALAAYFQQKRRLAFPLAAQEMAAQVGAIVTQIDELSAVLMFLREHVAALVALPGQVANISGQVGQAVALLEELTDRHGAAARGAERVGERTPQLTPTHVRAVQDRVNQLVRETAETATPLTYATIYGGLKRRFQARSYGEMADVRFEDIMAYLQEDLPRETKATATQ